MNPYRITYTRDDMPKGYIGSAVKYARDEKEALKHFCGTKPAKDAGSTPATSTILTNNKAL